MLRSFSSQKVEKEFSNSYNSDGEGAMRTTSSAKASKISYRDAIVYARLLRLCTLCILKYASSTGYTWSKNKVSNSGNAQLPHLTPKFAKNSNHSPDKLSKQIPFELTYMFLMICTRSAGRCKHCTKTFHNFVQFILSYAPSRFIKHNPIYLLVRKLCCSRVFKIRACSSVPWYALNPACVGACKFCAYACSVKRLFITAMNSFDKGGATAMLQ